jgi:hypothetical protein
MQPCATRNTYINMGNLGNLIEYTSLENRIHWSFRGYPF